MPDPIYIICSPRPQPVVLLLGEFLLLKYGRATAFDITFKEPLSLLDYLPGITETAYFFYSVLWQDATDVDRIILRLGCRR